MTVSDSGNCTVWYPVCAGHLVLSQYFNAGPQVQQRLIDVTCNSLGGRYMNVLFQSYQMFSFCVVLVTNLLHVYGCLLLRSYQSAHFRPGPPGTAD